MLLDDGKEALCGQGTAGTFPTCEVHGAGVMLQRAENCATKICHQDPSYGRTMAFSVSLGKKKKKKESLFSNQKHCTLEFLNYYYY